MSEYPPPSEAMPREVKTLSPLRRWLREERARENLADLAEAIDTMILPGGGRLRELVDWQPEPFDTAGGEEDAAMAGFAS